MKVQGFPNLSVIQAMRGHVDFYRLNGQSIARRWPRIRMRAPTPAQLWGRKVPSIVNDLRGRIPLYWWNAWNSMATPVGRTTWDTFTSVYSWLAHHHYVGSPTSGYPDQLDLPILPIAVEVVPRPTTTIVYIYTVYTPPSGNRRILINLAPAPDGKPADFHYVYTTQYTHAPGNRPPAYVWTYPIDSPLLFSQYPLSLQRFELYYRGVFTQCNFWTTFRFTPGEAPIRTNPPTSPIWFSGHFPTTPPGPWPPILAKWPWMEYWPPYYAAL